MSFSPSERQALLSLKGVGPTVVSRLEELGYRSLHQLRDATTEEIVTRAAALVGSTCRRNSPQARAAINAVLSLAQQPNPHAADS